MIYIMFKRLLSNKMNSATWLRVVYLATIMTYINCIVSCILDTLNVFVPNICDKRHCIMKDSHSVHLISTVLTLVSLLILILRFILYSVRFDDKVKFVASLLDVSLHCPSHWYCVMMSFSSTRCPKFMTDEFVNCKLFFIIYPMMCTIIKNFCLAKGYYCYAIPYMYYSLLGLFLYFICVFDTHHYFTLNE